MHVCNDIFSVINQFIITAIFQMKLGTLYMTKTINMVPV